MVEDEQRVRKPDQNLEASLLDSLYLNTSLIILMKETLYGMASATMMETVAGDVPSGDASAEQSHEVAFWEQFG